MSCPVWMLKTQLRSTGRATNVLNCHPSSLASNCHVLCFSSPGIISCLAPFPSSHAQTLWFSSIKFSLKGFYFSFRIKKTWPPDALYCFSINWISIPFLSDMPWTDMGPVAISLWGSVTSLFSTAFKMVKSSAMLASFSPFSIPGPLETAGRKGTSYIFCQCKLRITRQPLISFE